jgi:hypothetical protein
MKGEKCEALKRAIRELKEEKRKAASARNNKQGHFTEPRSLDEYLNEKEAQP